MKKLLTFLCAFAIAQFTFAQVGDNKNQNKPKEGIAKIADVMISGICDCFEKYGLQQLTPESRAMLKKLDDKKVKTAEDLQKVLAAQEIEALRKDMDKIDKGESQFVQCADKLEEKMEQYEAEIAASTSSKEDIDTQFEAEMIKTLKEKETCKRFYYFYLMENK
jgi:hypothetical protein